MSKEFITENGIAQVRYSSQQECLADNSTVTKNFLRTTPCKKAKVPGEFIILRRSKRGMNYILIYCNEYDIEFESGNAELMEDLSNIQIRELFNPEIVEAKELIEDCLDRRDLTMIQLRKIYKKGLSRAREIEYVDKLNMANFYKDILPAFLKTNSCRTKVFITPNLRAKIGG